MTRPPEVSILMPVRDGAAHLDEALASLAAQTLSDFELIVIDDGSTDGTADLLHAWAARDERIRCVSQEPLGIVAALELGRSLAQGVYLARMDADDVAHSERLERQRALMRSDATLAACGCGVEYFPAAVVRAGARRYQRWLNAAASPRQIEESLFIECPLAHPTFFLRADAVARVRGYRDCGWPEDYDLLLRLWADGGRLAKVPEVLLRWREGPERLSRTHPRYDAAAFRRCKAHFLARTLLKGRQAVVIWGAGPVGRRSRARSRPRACGSRRSSRSIRESSARRSMARRCSIRRPASRCRARSTSPPWASRGRATRSSGCSPARAAGRSDTSSRSPDAARASAPQAQGTLPVH